LLADDGRHGTKISLRHSGWVKIRDPNGQGFVVPLGVPRRRWC
jgi:hypothetical protein